MSRALCAGCATLMARLAAVEARLSLLEFSRPDRDRGAADVRHALASLWAGGIVFSAQDVIEATAHHADLRRALHMAMIQEAGEMGCWLRQHQGEKDGVVITRRGRRWFCTSSTYLHRADEGRP
jgi:hypothetical protein